MGLTRQVINLEAEQIDLKIGTLKVDLNSIGQGAVALDGKTMRCTKLDIHVVPGEQPRVRLEVDVI